MDGRKRKRANDPDSKSLVTIAAPANGQDVVSETPKRRRRLTSAVWNDFEKIKREGVDIALCRYCKKELSGSSSSGTTHLNNHLKRCPRKYNNEMQWMVVTAEKKKETSTTLKSFKYDEKKSRLELARMIIYHEYPFSIVEHVGFRRFVYSLCPSFNMISRNTIRADCMTLYESEKRRINEVLQKLCCRVNITLDLWNSYHNAGGNLCLMVHYLDDNWQLKKRIISFMHVEECHTGELFANFLMECITDWNIHHKLFSLTVDNECVDETAIREIKNRLCQSQLLLSDGQFFHVECAVYVIVSIVQTGFEKISKVMENIRACIEFIASPQHQETFEAIVRELNINALKTLQQDVSTQWDSTYSMLQAALDYKDVFIQFQSRVPELASLPSEEQWAEARALCSCLKIFFDVAKLLASTQHPTANLFFEEFCEIHLQLVEWCNQTDEVVSSIASMMKGKFDKYWDECNITLAVASVLDPRYKMKLVECYYPQIYGDSAEARIREVVDSFKNLYHEYATKPPVILSDGIVVLAIENGENNSMDGGYCSNVDSKENLRRFDRFLQENTQNQHLKSDLDEYLDEGVFPRDKDKSFNLWEWWKSNVGKYPILSKMARDVLAIPVAAVPSESAFSLGSRVLDSYRGSLNTETAQALICMQDWLKEEMGGSVSSLIDSVLPSGMEIPNCSPERTAVVIES